MKKWIGAVLALLFFVGLLAFLLPILGWQKQLGQESAEYEALSSAVQLPQASEPACRHAVRSGFFRFERPYQLA